MTTLTFVRKFVPRLVLGLAILALPNVVFATQSGGDSNTPTTSHHHGSGGSKTGDGTSTEVTLSISPETLTQVTSILDQLSSSGCTQVSGASSALTSLIGS